MPANWTTPITWNVDQLVTNTDLNAQLRDNMEYLLSPNHQRIIRDNSGDYSITNITTFQDIDSTNLSITLVTHGGPVWVHLMARVGLEASEAVFFDFALNGVRVGVAYDQGLGGTFTGSLAGVINLSVNVSILLTGLSAGTYVLRPQWRTTASDTITLNAYTTTSPVIFEAIEL